MLKAIENIAVVILESVGLEGTKFALGDVFAVLVVSGVAWVFLSAITGNIVLGVFSNWFGEERVYKSLTFVTILLGIATFYAGFYLYSIGF